MITRSLRLGKSCRQSARVNFGLSSVINFFVTPFISTLRDLKQRNGGFHKESHKKQVKIYCIILKSLL